MMKFSLSFVLSVFILLACCASAAQYSFSMKYKMLHSSKLQKGYIPGTLLYRYDTANTKSMRVHYKHTVYATSNSAATIVELENYERPRTFMKCGSTCESVELNRPIEPWYYVSTTDKATSTTQSVSGITYKRYTRTPKNNYGISAIWLKDTNAPSSKYLYKIEYKDGYVLEFDPSTYASASFTDAVFNDNHAATCVTDKCDPYMDVVFVFDESGSIKSSEFEDMKKFAKDVSALFTVGEKAAAIGLVTYAGNIDWRKSGCVGTGCKWKTFKDSSSSGSYGRCSCDQKNTSSSLKLTRKIFELTVVDVNAKIQKCKQQGGNTCQGYGFLSAWELMTQTNFRLKKGYNKPYSVAIGLTDGADACPNKTFERAKLIKNNLKGTVLEVGIGLDTNYDKDFLKRVASKIDGTPAYYDASSFKDLANKVKAIANKICTSTYSTFHGCKSGCSGYCGCDAKCYCPACTAQGDKCISRSCSVSSETTAGCKDTSVNCVQSDKCYNYGCNSASGCTKTAKNCNSGLYTCQTSRCSASTGCIADNHDDKCPPKPCHTAKCAPGDPKRDSTTGCVYTNTCTGPSPTTSGGCIEYTCTSGKCVTKDTCTSKNTACTTYKCNTNTNKCVVATNVTCTDGPCQHHSGCDLKTGKCVSQNKDHEYCVGVLKKAGQTSFACTKAYCDPNHNKNEHCRLMSLGENCEICGQSGQKSDTQCQDEANKKVTTTNPKSCYTGVCVGYRDSDQSPKSKCSFTENVCNPPDACHETTCGANGLCQYAPRNTVTADKCHKVICNAKTGKYELEYTGCGRPDNLCQEETCDGSTGTCSYKKRYAEYNCTVAKCDSKTGKVSYAPRVCESINRCFASTCNVSKNACESVRLENDVACKNDDKCKESVCDEATGKCTISDRVHKGGEGDQCLKYVCDPVNGTWTLVGGKCDDGLLCTIDNCDYNGECSYEDRICDLNMTGYGECFISACSESRKNGCYRKIAENSYFDECGNCIGGYRNGVDDPSAKNSTECKKALTWEEKAAAISAGVAAGIIIACVIGAIGVSIGGTLLTRELIRRAKAAADSGAVSNPIYEDNGRELSNPAFEGNDA